MKGIEFDPGDLGGDLCTIAGAVEGEARVSDYHLRRYAHVKVTAAPGAGPMFVSFEWLAREELPYAWMVDACEQGARTALAEPLADGRRVVLCACVGRRRQLSRHRYGQRVRTESGRRRRSAGAVDSEAGAALSS